MTNTSSTTTVATTPVATTPDLPAEGLSAPAPVLPPDDPRDRFRRTVETATACMRAVRPDDLGRPTPCEDFDVRGLQGHLVDVIRRVAAMGRGEDIFAIAPVVPADIADDAWLGLWLAGAQDVERVWADDEVLTRTIVLPWSTASGADTLLGYVAEIAVHTWDLAQATGQQPSWDDDALTAALAVQMARLPGEQRLEKFAEMTAGIPEHARRPRPPFQEAVPVPDGAPVIDRLVAWCGRSPHGEQPPA